MAVAQTSTQKAVQTCHWRGIIIMGVVLEAACCHCAAAFRPWTPCTCPLAPQPLSKLTPLQPTTCTPLARTVHPSPRVTPSASLPLRNPPMGSHPQGRPQMLRDTSVSLLLGSQLSVTPQTMRQALASQRLGSRFLGNRILGNHRMGRALLANRPSGSLCMGRALLDSSPLGSHHMGSLSLGKRPLGSRRTGRLLRCHSSRHRPAKGLVLPTTPLLQLGDLVEARLLGMQVCFQSVTTYNTKSQRFVSLLCC